MSSRSTSIALRTLIAVLCVVLQTSSLAHMLLVRHDACPEHGELVHADDDADADAHAHTASQLAAEAGPQTAGARVQNADAAARGHADEHCALAAMRRELAIVPAASVATLVLPPLAATIPAAFVATRVSAVPHYHFAPKTSPPSA